MSICFYQNENALALCPFQPGCEAATFSAVLNVYTQSVSTCLQLISKWQCVSYVSTVAKWCGGGYLHCRAAMHDVPCSYRGDNAGGHQTGILNHR